MKTPERHSEVCRLFKDACNLSPAEHPRFVAEACAGDTLLRQELEAMLARDREHPDFLETPAVFRHMPELAGAEQSSPTSHARIPNRIGRYKILEPLGEGGMALVYLAEQENPHRRVAVKIIKPGFASDEAIKRFEFEAQILGRLQHPGIAQIFEADTADVGFGAQPFFAMEYVSGQELCQYARDHSPEIRERLHLFISVCAAVQHAHQNGVIHRDLKPSNILVDKAGRPKVLDFGIARVTDSDRQTTIMRTSFRQLIGTIPYMSPEQVTGDSRQVDVRSDVYALGVILYELLAGRLPIDVSSLSIPDAIVQIRELDPPPLSTVAKSFRGELETIVAKALEKDKLRRYQSASDLAGDLQRYLRGDPIEAKRHSTMYVLGKNLRRYRWAVTVGVAFVVGLVAFAAYASVQASRFSLLAQQEREAREQSQAAREEAVVQRKAALLEAERARAISSFLQDTLGLTNPDVTQSPGLTMKEVLDRTSDRIDDALADQPETEAAVRMVIGKAYFALGELERADLHLMRAWKLRLTIVHSTPAELYDAIQAFASAHSYLGDAFARTGMWNQIYFGRQIIGATHPELVSILAELPWRELGVDEHKSVLQLYDRIMRVAHSELELDDPLWIYVSDQLFGIGARLQYWEPRDLALPFVRQSIQIRRRLAPQSYTEIVTQLGRLCECLVAAGRHEDAETAARESLDLIARLLPPNHWYAAFGEARLGASLVGQGRHEEAERILLDANQRIIEVLGPESGRHSIVLMSLVELYDAWGKPKAAAEYRDRLAVCLARSGRETPLPAIRLVFDARHTELLDALQTLYLALLGRPEDLSPALHAVLDIRAQLVPDDDPRAAVIAHYLLRLWYEGDETKDYQIGSEQLQLELYSEGVERLRASPHARPLPLAKALMYQALSLEKQGEFVRAEQAAREGLLLRQQHGARPRHIATAKSILGGCLVGQARYAEAEPLLKEGFLALAGDLGLRVSYTPIILERLYDLYAQWGQPERMDAVLAPLAERALDRTGNPWELKETSWAIAKSPGFSELTYRLALKVAEKAVAIAPDDPEILNTLGVARYRSHQYDLALESLERSNGLAGGTSYADLAFLAMTQWRLGSSQQASKMLEQLHELVANRVLHDNRECMGFLLEAESLMAGDSTPPAAG